MLRFARMHAAAPRFSLPSPLLRLPQPLVRRTSAQASAASPPPPPPPPAGSGSLWRRAAPVIGWSVLAACLGVAGTVAYLRASLGGEAVERMARTYYYAVPAFAAYKWVQIVEEGWLGRDQELVASAYEALHAVHAPRMRDVFMSLRGFNIKTGQLIAGNMGGGAPRAWQEVFEPFLDAVPAKPFPAVRATVEAALGGAALESVFSEFDEAPLAAASIGQVHRARLRDGGRRVVVKVGYTDVEQLFRGDIATARFFMTLALPEHLPALAEIEKQFVNEFDYTREAAQLTRVRANLARAGTFSDIIVPAPVPHLCSKHVLVMEEVPACEKLPQALQRDMAAFAADAGISPAALAAREAAADAAALARGELRCGPSAADMAAFIAARRWRNALLAPLAWAWPSAARPAHVPLNHAAMMDELMRVHGHEILVDGEFNADPHPGNVLVSRASPAAAPRLALVDYGQVKTLDAGQRLKLARLMAALARCGAAPPRAARARVAALLADMGFATARGDVDVAFESAVLYFDRDDKLVTKGMHVQAYVEALAARDPVKTVGDDYVLVARASLLLRGLGHALNQHRSAAAAWRPMADAVLRAAGEDPDALLLAPPAA